MSRNDRILSLALIITLLTVLTVTARSLHGDMDPGASALVFLFLLAIIHFLRPLKTVDLILLIICLLPALFYVFHFLCWLSMSHSLLMTLKCCLMLSLYKILWLFIESLPIKQNTLKTVLQLAAGLALPLISGFFLLEQNILFLLLLPVMGGLLLYYRTKVKNHG